MSNKKESANSGSSAKAIESINMETLKNRLSYQFSLLGLPENSEDAVNNFVSLLVESSWAKETKNGALKYTTSKPEKKDDHGKGKNTVTPFYLVSSGTGKSNALMSLRSFVIYTLAQIALKKKQENAKTFDEWLASNKTLYNMINKASEAMRPEFEKSAKAEYQLYLDALKLEAVTIEEE